MNIIVSPIIIIIYRQENCVKMEKIFQGVNIKSRTVVTNIFHCFDKNTGAGKIQELGHIG